jgi:hypothetical protein
MPPVPPRRPPAAGGYWALLYKGERCYPVMRFVAAGDKMPRDIVYWCVEGGKTWWRCTPSGFERLESNPGSTSGKQSVDGLLSS